MSMRNSSSLVCTLLAGIFGASLRASSAAADEAPKWIPAPALDEPAGDQSETAVLSGGCFWGMQGVFEHLKGVESVLAGYSGGAGATAQYEIVSSGMTGHAESVKIVFDPQVISYGEILRIYFSVAHDPTELDRQGPDDGRQYRSNIFYASDWQRRVALAYIQQLSNAHVFGAPIVTRVDRLGGFYRAEDYHQDYLVRHPDAPYIVYNDLPKLDAFKHLYAPLYRETPVTTRARS